jgi:hypothetical protein
VYVSSTIYPPTLPLFTHFLKARSAAEAHIANSLVNNTTGRKGTQFPWQLLIRFPHRSPGTGFNADDGASLFLAFRGLQAESVAQGQAHHTVADELATLVADPFEDWAEGYKVTYSTPSPHI